MNESAPHDKAKMRAVGFSPLLAARKVGAARVAHARDANEVSSFVGGELEMAAPPRRHHLAMSTRRDEAEAQASRDDRQKRPDSI